jgi:TetR/AcrR family transcriptional repressor of cmeABC operon
MVGKTRSTPKGDARRDAFIRVAADLFLEKGFEKTSVNEIVRRAGGSLSTLYAHFHTKEELFESIIREISQHLLAPLEDLSTDEKPVRDVLRELGLRYVRVLSHRKALALYRIMVSEAHRFPALRQVLLGNGVCKQNALTSYLSKKAGQGLLRIDDIELAAFHYFGLLRGPWHLQAACGERVYLPPKRRAVIVDLAVDIFMAYYGPAATTR